jgi:Fic family protein
LAPQDLDINNARTILLNDTIQALKKLDIATNLVSGQEWLLYGFVRKEAVVSSQIEGTQATLIDLLNSEEDEQQNEDLEEVCNYLAALKYAWDELTTTTGLPLSLRLIKEAHRRLMRGVRGQNKTPGEFRISQNWIGGMRPSDATFVPPPPNEMNTCLNQLEEYFYKEDAIPPLIRVAMIHVQFETIHPFLDGNGRIGRLLIALLLRQYGLMRSPLLYVSLYFKKHRYEYYELLNRVRTHGDWETWIDYFLKAIKTVAEDVVDTSTRLHQNVTRDRERLLKHSKVTIASMRLFEELPRKPIITLTEAVQRLELTKPPVLKAMSILVEMGILVEATGKKRDRTYRYKGYLDILAEGTEL